MYCSPAKRIATLDSVRIAEILVLRPVALLVLGPTVCYDLALRTQHGGSALTHRTLVTRPHVAHPGMVFSKHSLKLGRFFKRNF
jgi:hypothetical protein